VPEVVQTGGDLQYAEGVYYVNLAVQFDSSYGTGMANRRYAYHPDTDSWSAAANCVIGGKGYGHEALAYDAVGRRLYATVIGYQTTGDSTATRKLAVYDPNADQWTGFTAATTAAWGNGTEAEYLDGKVYVWRGGFNGALFDGSDSWLDVYTIATNSWSRTPSLADSDVMVGFRSGATDLWGVTITSDPVSRQLFVLGGVGNRQVYVFAVATQRWAATPDAPYDGGWGDGLEYVSATQRLYLIDGRNAGSVPQGTAVLVDASGDVNLDGHVGLADFVVFEVHLAGPGAGGAVGQELLDFDCDGSIDLADFAGFQTTYTGP
jgi:N-acetylneuraminic acid mutarotase